MSASALDGLYVEPIELSVCSVHEQSDAEL